MESSMPIGMPGIKEAAIRPTDDLKKLKAAAESFESFFIYSLLKEMRKSIPEGGLLDSGTGKDIYQYMFDEAIAKKMSESGGIGLAKMLIQTYERQHSPSPKAFSVIGR